MGEGLPANLTSVRFFPAVYALVYRQLRPLRESRTTMRAAVRLIILVRPQVLREVAFKILVANLAVESFNIPVQTTQVFPQSVPPIKSLPAQIANIIPFIQVPLHMQL